MKFVIPRAGSRPYQMLCAVKRLGPMTDEQILNADSNWYGYRNLSGCRKELDAMVGKGSLKLVAGRVVLSKAAIEHFRIEGEPEPAPEVVAPREAVPFSPLKYLIAAPRREGAMDYREIPSLMGGERVPFWGGDA